MTALLRPSDSEHNTPTSKCLMTGTASAMPQNPDPRIDYSDGGPIVECIQCAPARVGDGSVRVNPGIKPGAGFSPTVQFTSFSW